MAFFFGLLRKNSSQRMETLDKDSDKTYDGYKDVKKDKETLTPFVLGTKLEQLRRLLNQNIFKKGT